MAQDDYEGEHVLLQLRECQVYRIPPRTNAAGHYAKDWGELSKPIWIGRCVLTEKGEDLFVKLQHDDGRDFAVCKAGPGAVEPVVDSSRYFVLRIEDPRTGKHAFLGMGFLERSQAFDFNAAIADHEKHIRMEKEAAKAAQDYESRPRLDLSLKAPITVSLNISKTGGTANKQVGSGILAPPPKTIVFSAPRQTTTQSTSPTPTPTAAQPKAAVPQDFSFDDDWGDFASAPSGAPAPKSASPATPFAVSTAASPAPSSPASLPFTLPTSAVPLGINNPLSGYNSPTPTAGPNYHVSPVLGGPRPGAAPVYGIPGGLQGGYGMTAAPVYGVPMSGGMPGVVPGGQVRYAGLQGAGAPGVSPMGSPYMGLSPAGSPGLGGRPVSPGMMNSGSPSLIPAASSPKTATGPDPFASLAVFK